MKLSSAILQRETFEYANAITSTTQDVNFIYNGTPTVNATLDFHITYSLVLCGTMTMTSSWTTGTT